MKRLSIWDFIVGIIIFIIIGYVLILLVGPFFYLIVFLLLIYIGYFIYQLVKERVENSKKDKFDSDGRRITKASILEIEDADVDDKNKDKKND